MSHLIRGLFEWLAMPQGRACLRSLNPLNLKPGLEYAELLLRFSKAPYAVSRIDYHASGCDGFLGLARCPSSLDATFFDAVARRLIVEARGLMECASNATRSGIKPNCGVPEVDDAIREAQANPRNKQALEKINCLILSNITGRLLSEASGRYTILKSINPCGLGSIILLPGSGIHELPQSKLGIARLLGKLLPDYIQIAEGWSDYTRLAYLITKVPKELLPHVTALAGRVLSVDDIPSDRLEAYITIEALLSRELGFIALIDFEGEEPFVVKFPKAPFKPDS